MKVSGRELVLMLATLGVGLFSVTAVVARPKFDQWKALRSDQAQLRQEIAQDARLLASRAEWEKKFEELKAYLPQYPVSKQMDVHWLSIMDNLAAKNGVRIARREVGEEKRVGDIFELPIEVRDWDASLDAFVHFLFDLQSQGAMLDVRQLLMKPNDQKALQGRFVLYCAYTREAPIAAPGAAPVPAVDAGAAAETP